MNAQQSTHESMKAWDNTWRPHHLPMWAKKRMRAHAIKNGKWQVGIDLAYRITFLNSLFDHWGSIERSGLRLLVTQPYGNKSSMAAQLASEMQCDVEEFTPGPWNAGTWCYIFTPKQYSINP